MYANVLVELKSKNITGTYTYKIIEPCFVGCRVLVEFGHQKLEGFVLKITNEAIDYEVKDIIKVIDEKPVLNEELLALGKYISTKTYLFSCFSYLTSCFSAIIYHF